MLYTTIKAQGLSVPYQCKICICTCMYIVVSIGYEISIEECDDGSVYVYIWLYLWNERKKISYGEYNACECMYKHTYIYTRLMTINLCVNYDCHLNIIHTYIHIASPLNSTYTFDLCHYPGFRVTSRTLTMV